jgi:uncharacterized protein YbcI
MSASTESISPQKTISRGMVGIYKNYLGRGPTRAVTTIAGDHTTVVLEDSLTKAELRLVAEGEGATVRSIRRKFQMAMARDIRDLVESATGRESKCLLSDHDVELDIAVETVMFEDAAPDAA